MFIYTIYLKPGDFPFHVVVRRFKAPSTESILWYVKELQYTDIFSIETALKNARNSLPKGLTKTPRSPNDIPSIVESWY